LETSIADITVDQIARDTTAYSIACFENLTANTGTFEHSRCIESSKPGANDGDFRVFHLYESSRA
jgi:hypothetical protein